jgi:O-antigen/teichoic acid export membrane protein
MLHCSFALPFTGIFGVFSDLGLSTLTVREVARDKALASKYLGNIAVMKIFLKKGRTRAKASDIFLN